ncbi:thioredoxin domain-containing protein 11 [Aricia agestis]|uniref:thioredoxin domain-containing protein 11 n=1 Tax=Aricia agestis TaxID=91739 RepID=UPI001C20A093|nr:thioredoxin domain-containing protein 11 [Aricia agestis]
MISTVDSKKTTQGTSLKTNRATSDEPEEKINTQVPKQSNSRDITFNMLLIETVFCIVLAVTTYGALHSFPSKVSKVPQAVRFFDRNSVVKDWYKGELSAALSVINSQDVSFVMYYAPWDAESQYVRGEFEKAANVLNDRVHFSAINCWNPGSECRLQHSKVPSWPILIVYSVTSRGILYKGPRDSESMIRFLELIMKPMERVSSTEDIVHLLSICDAVAIGFTPLTETSKYYNVWFSVALKSKEYDTVGELCFATVTSSELAHSLGVDTMPRARLLLWNETKEYKISENQEWNDTALITWVLENFSQPVVRIIPMWKKSFSFGRYADGNPILILFTPMNPLYEEIPVYALLREVAMEYYNCKSNVTFQWTAELGKLQQIQRLIYQQKNLFKPCQASYDKPAKVTQTSKKQFITEYNKNPWYNVTQNNMKNEMFDYIFKHGLAISKLIENSNEKSAFWNTMGFLDQCGYEKSLPAEKSYYDRYEKCQTLEEHLQRDFDFNVDDKDDEIETTMLPLEDDPLSAENLVRGHIRHYCKLMHYAYKLTPTVYPAKVKSGNITHLDGLSCATNSSLYFIALDSVRNYHFAEALGVDIKNKKDMTAVIILDSKQESQYVLSKEYSAQSVREFIYNFTRSNLKRSLRTHVQDAKHTHYFGSSGNADITGNLTVIQDLTTRTFRKFIRTPGTLKLLGVCGGACGAHVTRALVSAARLLRSCGVAAAPARLDAARHDLPWAYTSSVYPVLHVFPADADEAESRVYPSHVRVSAGGLTALALRSLPAPRRLRVRLALCALPAEQFEKKKCLRDLRHHIAALISRNLKSWRRTDVRQLKDSLFRRLVHLHRVSLYISVLHHDDLKSNKRQELLVQALNTLADNWNNDAQKITR